MRVWSVVLALLLLAAVGRAPGAAVPSAGVLRAPEVALGSPAQLPKWRRVLAALASEERLLRACLQRTAACRDDRMRAWREAVLAAAGRPLRERLERVNRFVNGFRYRSDSDLWQQSDYWATPLEFLARSGDCEDYAIAKYATLRLLAVPERDMRLVVLHDTRRDLVHAVLTVAVDGRRFVLDNLYDRVLPEERLPQYRPYYSVNAEGLWRALPSTRTVRLDAGQLQPARR
jgi:predicted transglutaminase-like cysteine proteinase